MAGLTARQSKPDSEGSHPPGWLDWAERHPGALLLGILFVAAAFLVPEPTCPPLEVDSAGDEIPLFI
jgi:hypothetical protein